MKSLLRSFFVSLIITLSLFILIFILLFRQNFKSESNQSQSSENLILVNRDNKASNISLFITGDVMLGRTVMTKSFELKDFAYPFRNVADKMRASDIVFINLENPIVDSCPLRETGLVFCTDPLLIEGLLFAGVDVVNLANNHILNYGIRGKEETLMHLENANILAAGAGDLIKLERNGVTFGFLGFDKSEQTNPKLGQDETDLIVKSDAKVDVLVVATHWGIEYQDNALPGVRSLAKEIVGLGADVIVGHHPHWVQDYELINGKPVYYSLGNFIFDQMWSEKTRTGLAVELVYDGDGILKGYELLPVYMSLWAQPEFIE